MTGINTIVKTNTKNNNQYVYFPRNTGSCIESLSTTVNNYMIEYIENYNQVFNIHKDWTNGSADTLKNDFLFLPDPFKFETMELNGDITKIVSGVVKTSADKMQYHRNRPLCIKEFLGFLGSSASSHVNTNLAGEIRVKICWSPVKVLFRNGDTANSTNVVNTPATYTLTNMYATISRVMMDNTYYDLMSSRVLNSGIDIGFTTFTRHQGNLTNMMQNFNFNVKSSSIKYIVGTLLDNNYKTMSQIQSTTSATAFESQLSATELYNQSIYFKKDAVVLDASVFEIDNVMGTPYPLPVEEVYVNNEFAFNTNNKGKHHEGLKSLLAFRKYNFFHCHSLGFRDPDGIYTISGLDSKNSSANIVYRTTGTGADVVPLCYCAIDKVLEIQAGQDVEVIG